MKPQMDTDKHGFYFDFIRVYLCPSVVSYICLFLSDYLDTENTE